MFSTVLQKEKTLGPDIIQCTKKQLMSVNFASGAFPLYCLCGICHGSKIRIFQIFWFCFCPIVPVTFPFLLNMHFFSMAIREESRPSTHSDSHIHLGRGQHGLGTFLWTLHCRHLAKSHLSHTTVMWIYHLSSVKPKLRLPSGPGEQSSDSIFRGKKILS